MEPPANTLLAEGAASPAETSQVAASAEAITLRNQLWASGVVVHEGNAWPWLSLGWSEEAWRGGSDASWLLTLAQDASFDIVAPWESWEHSQREYADRIFPRTASGSRSLRSTTHASSTPPPPIASFKLASRRILADALVPAAEVIDAAMQRPLGNLAADGSVISSSTDAPLPVPLFIGQPLEDAPVGESLVPFWERTWHWEDEIGLQRLLWKGILRAANAVHQACGGAGQGVLRWRRDGKRASVNSPPDFYLTHEIDGEFFAMTARIVAEWTLALAGRAATLVVVEVEPFLTMETAQRLVLRGRERRKEHARKARGSEGAHWEAYVEEDALFGQCVRQA